MIVRGGGELASAAARLLFLTGFPVLVLEREQPLAVRRRVCFAEAIATGEARVEGVRARRLSLTEVPGSLGRIACVVVAVDPAASCLPAVAPAVLIDARMAKQPCDTRIDQAPLVIGLGPGFTAGVNVHAVVETNRGPNLGRVVWQGSCQPDTREPSPVLGITTGRVVRAPAAGRFVAQRSIGDLVQRGEPLGQVGDVPVPSPIAGLVRGLVADGLAVERDFKLGDIDPHGAAIDPAQISDKARAIAAGVLEAVTWRDRGSTARAWRRHRPGLP